ncbi:hypothetical protein ACFOHS_01050 [Jhaorihella thermophila]
MIGWRAGGPGNWSGSAKAELRTLRAGACMARSAGTTWLIYGYFSTATPSAMARTFQAYGCDYAMLLDMNALEHTYLALYVPQGAHACGTYGARHVPDRQEDGRRADSAALHRFCGQSRFLLCDAKGGPPDETDPDRPGLGGRGSGRPGHGADDAATGQ